MPAGARCHRCGAWGRQRWGPLSSVTPLRVLAGGQGPARAPPRAPGRERYVGGKNRNGGQIWADGRRWGNGGACWILTAPARRQRPGEGDRAARASPPRGRSHCHPSNPARIRHRQLSLQHPRGWGQREDGPEPASTQNPAVPRRQHGLDGRTMAALPLRRCHGAGGCRRSIEKALPPPTPPRAPSPLL